MSFRLLILSPRRWFKTLLVLAAVAAGPVQAQTWLKLTPAPVNIGFNAMPLRTGPGMTSQGWKALTDAKEDFFPSSTASYYYSVTAGNTYGSATIAAKADWWSKSMDWVVGKATNGAPGPVQRGVAAIEQGLQWIDDVITPEVTMRTEQMADFQRMLKAYQLYRQFEIMAKSWTGSVFKFDVLDVIPVYEQNYLDEFGISTTGVRVGIKYKDRQGSGDLLSSFGLDNPYVGPFNASRLKYKGPQKFSGIGIDIEASPYQGTVTDSGALRIGKDGNEILDRVFFEGMMGRNMAHGNVYYTSKATMDRPSPVLLRQRAQTYADERQTQILNQADAYAKLYKVDSVTALNLHIDELQYWQAQPNAIYENQMQRINRLRDEVQPIQNDVVKLEIPEKLQESSDPSRKTFMDSVFNLYKRLGDSASDVLNAADPESPLEDDENNGHRQMYKAEVNYTKATHAAYLEALAIRRYLAAKVMAESQRGAGDAFYNLWKSSEETTSNVAKAQVRVAEYQKKANRVIDGMNKLGINFADLHAEIKARP